MKYYFFYYKYLGKVGMGSRTDEILPNNPHVIKEWEVTKKEYSMSLEELSIRYPQPDLETS